MQLRGLCGRVAVTTLASSDPVSPELRSAYDAQKLVPLWESGTTGFSQGGEQPRHWPWEAIGPILRETAHITVPSIVERRVLMMMNPTIPRNDAESCAGLVSAGVQALMPGEIARPHRHAMHALRFVLEGEGAETIVEGKACAMEPGDLVVTPGWAWHEHHNKGGKPTLWVDILDLAIHRAMRTDMFQPGPVNALRAVPADRAYGAAGIVPVGIEENEVARAGHTMMFRYPAGPAQAAAANAPQDQCGIRLARYVDPRNGGAIVPTIDCYLMQLEEAETAKARSSASSWRGRARAISTEPASPGGAMTSLRYRGGQRWFTASPRAPRRSSWRATSRSTGGWGRQTATIQPFSRQSERPPEPNPEEE